MYPFIYVNRMAIVMVFAALCCGLAQAQSGKQDCTLRLKSASTATGQQLAQDLIKANPCTTVPGLDVKSLSSVWSALLTSSSTGGKRFDTPPPAGTPTGKVLLGAQGLVFDLQSVFGDGVTQLQISVDDVPVFNIVNPKGPLLTLPAARLKPETVYDWVLITRKNSYKASFRTAAPGELADLQHQLDVLATATLSPSVRLLYTAAIYDDAEFYFARDEILAKLRPQVAP